MVRPPKVLAGLRPSRDLLSRFFLDSTEAMLDRLLLVVDLRRVSLARTRCVRSPMVIEFEFGGELEGPMEPNDGSFSSVCQPVAGRSRP